MLHFLVAILHCAQHVPSVSQRDIFKQAIECSRALMEFYFYSQYDSHNEQTLGLMSTALQGFNNSKDVFRQFVLAKGSLRKVKLAERS